MHSVLLAESVGVDVLGVADVVIVLGGGRALGSPGSLKLTQTCQMSGGSSISDPVSMLAYIPTIVTRRDQECGASL